MDSSITTCSSISGHDNATPSNPKPCWHFHVILQPSNNRPITIFFAIPKPLSLSLYTRKERRREKMCPLRLILIFLSATLAGFFLLKNLKSQPEILEDRSEDSVNSASESPAKADSVDRSSKVPNSDILVWFLGFIFIPNFRDLEFVFGIDCFVNL